MGELTAFGKEWDCEARGDAFNYYKDTYWRYVMLAPIAFCVLRMVYVLFFVDETPYQ